MTACLATRLVSLPSRWERAAFPVSHAPLPRAKLWVQGAGLCVCASCAPLPQARPWVQGAGLCICASRAPLPRARPWVQGAGLCVWFLLSDPAGSAQCGTCQERLLKWLGTDEIQWLLAWHPQKHTNRQTNTQFVLPSADRLGKQFQGPATQCPGALHWFRRPQPGCFWQSLWGTSASSPWRGSGEHGSLSLGEHNPLPGTAPS